MNDLLEPGCNRSELPGKPPGFRAAAIFTSLHFFSMFISWMGTRYTHHGRSLILCSALSMSFLYGASYIDPLGMGSIWEERVSSLLSRMEGILIPRKQTKDTDYAIVVAYYDEDSIAYEKKQVPPPYRFQTWAINQLLRLNPDALFIDIDFSKSSDSAEERKLFLESLSQKKLQSDTALFMAAPKDSLGQLRKGIFENSDITFLDPTPKDGITRERFSYDLKANNVFTSPALALYRKLKDNDFSPLAKELDIVWKVEPKSSITLNTGLKTLLILSTNLLETLSCPFCSTELQQLNSSHNGLNPASSRFLYNLEFLVSGIKDLIQPQPDSASLLALRDSTLDTEIIEVVFPPRLIPSSQDKTSRIELNTEGEESFLQEAEVKLGRVGYREDKKLAVIYAGDNQRRINTPTGARKSSLIHALALESLLENGTDFRRSASERSGDRVLQLLYFACALFVVLGNLLIWESVLRSKTLLLFLMSYGSAAFMLVPLGFFSSCLSALGVLSWSALWLIFFVTAKLFPPARPLATKLMLSAAVISVMLTSISLFSFLAVNQLHHGPSVFFTFSSIAGSGTTFFLASLFGKHLAIIPPVESSSIKI